MAFLDFGTTPRPSMQHKNSLPSKLPFSASSNEQENQVDAAHLALVEAVGSPRSHSTHIGSVTRKTILFCMTQSWSDCVKAASDDSQLLLASTNFLRQLKTL